MPFQLSQPDEDATIRGILKHVGWIAQVPLSLEETPDTIEEILHYQPGLKDCLAAAAVAMTELAPTLGCGFWFLNEAREELVLSAHSLENGWTNGARLPVTHGFWKDLLAGDSVRLCPAPAVLPSGTTYLMAVPLRAGTLTFGVMALFLAPGAQVAPNLEHYLAAITRLVSPALFCAVRREVEKGLFRETQTSSIVAHAVERIMATEGVEQRLALRVIQQAAMHRRQSRRRIAEGLLLADKIKTNQPQVSHL